MIKGKQESPGANEGRRRVSVLVVEESWDIPKLERTSGVIKNIIKLNTRTTNGTNNNEISNSIFNNAINIVEGKATESTISLMPSSLSFPPNLDFSINPTPIKSTRIIVFNIASFMIICGIAKQASSETGPELSNLFSLLTDAFKSGNENFHFIHSAHTYSTHILVKYAEGSYTDTLSTHFC